MNPSGMTDTSIIEAIQPDDTVPYLVMRVAQVETPYVVQAVRNEYEERVFPKFTCILDNGEGKTIQCVVCGYNVDLFGPVIQQGEVIAIKNAFAKEHNDFTKGNAPFFLNILSNVNITPLENGSYDEMENFVMKLRFGTGSIVPERKLILISDYDQQLQACLAEQAA